MFLLSQAVAYVNEAPEEQTLSTKASKFAAILKSPTASANPMKNLKT